MSFRARCSADRAQSERTFDLYHDCLTDARAHGYEVELTHAQGNTAPGGAEYHLRNRGDSGEQ